MWCKMMRHKIMITKSKPTNKNQFGAAISTLNGFVHVCFKSLNTVCSIAHSPVARPDFRANLQRGQSAAKLITPALFYPVELAHHTE